jgi:hypothetical protein
MPGGSARFCFLVVLFSFFFEKSRRSRQRQSETSFFKKADQVVKKRNLKRFSPTIIVGAACSVCA